MKFISALIASLLIYFAQPAFAVNTSGLPISRGSFTVTFATGCTTTPTMTWTYVKVGSGPASVVTITTGGTTVTCTSNATNFFISGLPTFLRPITQKTPFMPDSAEDNGVASLNTAVTLSNGSNIALTLCTATQCIAGFTAAGLKGVMAFGTFSYGMD